MMVNWIGEFEKEGIVEKEDKAKQKGNVKNGEKEIEVARLV